MIQLPIQSPSIKSQRICDHYTPLSKYSAYRESRNGHSRSMGRNAFARFGLSVIVTQFPNRFCKKRLANAGNRKSAAFVYEIGAGATCTSLFAHQCMCAHTKIGLENIGMGRCPGRAHPSGKLNFGSCRTIFARHRVISRSDLQSILIALKSLMDCETTALLPSLRYPVYANLIRLRFR